MLLKIDLGIKRNEKLGDETCDNQDPVDEVKRIKKQFVGFLTNISSSQKLNYPSANNESRLNKKLKPVIEDFKQTADSKSQYLGLQHPPRIPNLLPSSKKM